MNATDYLKLWEKHEVWKRLTNAKHQERFRRITSFLKGETFIDIGCAYGHSTYHLKKMVGGKWTGVDFDQTAIAKAKKLFPNINFIYLPDTAQIKTLPLFDGVVCSEVIEHVEHDQRLVDNLIAITGEVLVITTPSKKVKSKGHLRVYNVEMLFRLFENHPTFYCIEYHPFYYVVYDRKLKK